MTFSTAVDSLIYGLVLLNQRDRKKIPDWKVVKVVMFRRPI